MVVRDVTMKFLHSLQNQFVTLAVRAPESPPVLHSRKQFLACLQAGREKKVQEVVGDCSNPERIFSQLSEAQTKQQQNQRNNNFRVIFVEFVLPLPEVNLHSAPLENNNLHIGGTVFLLQLSHFKQWIVRGATDTEWERLTRLLAGMHWSVQVSYADGKPVAVRWYDCHDCGFRQPSLCIVPEPTPRFAYTDAQFLRACGVVRQKSDFS
jgi:hypothetical protein